MGPSCGRTSPVAIPCPTAPVTLASNLCKLLERMVARLSGGRARATAVRPPAAPLHRSPPPPGLAPSQSSAALTGHQGMRSACGLCARALGSVDHGALTTALRGFDVDPRLTRWAMEFSDDRRACVGFRTRRSKMAEFACGAPQGSAVGPLHHCGGLAECGAQRNTRTAPRPLC